MQKLLDELRELAWNCKSASEECAKKSAKSSKSGNPLKGEEFAAKSSAYAQVLVKLEDIIARNI